MPPDLQTRLTALETTLKTLLSTLPALHLPLPSTNPLLTFSAIDVSRTLDQLAAWQSAHAHTTAQHAVALDLVARQQRALVVLAEARTRILATPVAPMGVGGAGGGAKGGGRGEKGGGGGGGVRREVPFAEVLEYAREIARFGPPVEYRPPGGETIATTAAAAARRGEDHATPKEPGIGGTTTDENGITSTAAAATNGADDAKPSRTNGTSEVNGAATAAAASSFPSSFTSSSSGSASENPALLMLSGAEKAWLDPEGQKVFLPWPSEEMIQRGALVRLQAMVEKGVGLEEARVEEEEVGAVVMEEVRKDKETEKEQEQKEEKEVKLELQNEDIGKVIRTEHLDRVPEVRREKPKVFGTIDLYVPEEEA